MHLFTAKEAIVLFREYEVKCDEKEIQEWLDDPYAEHPGGELDEKDVWAFSEWCAFRGTAYEAGIDDKTKIERLLMEIQNWEEKYSKLSDEKLLLELQLGISPFD